MWNVLMCMCISSSYCFDWSCNVFMLEWKLVFEKVKIYVTVAVGSIQGKSRFTVAVGESRNSTVAVGGMLVFNKNSVKR